MLYDLVGQIHDFLSQMQKNTIANAKKHLKKSIANAKNICANAKNHLTNAKKHSKKCFLVLTYSYC